MYKKSGHRPFKDLELEKIFSSNLHAFEKAAELMQLSDRERTNPVALIKHEENQLVEHSPDDHFATEWESLARTLNSAKETLNTNDANRIACAFYWLGIASSKLDSEKSDNNYQIAVLDSHIARIKSNLPLEKKKIAGQMVKGIAIKFANIYWKENENNGEHEQPRISEAAEYIQQTIKDIFLSEPYKWEIEGSGYEIPEDIAIIKKWLRPTAPAWAKKGGRPSKKTKLAKK